MPRVNVWIPDELHTTIRSALPDLNVSQVLREALAGLLECRHDELACRSCATPVDHHQLRTVALGRFYSDLLWALDPLIRRVGTAEGAARIVKDIGERHQIPEASRLPLPRPTRANRLDAKVSEFPLEAASRERHPSNQPTTAITKAGAA